jgi:hypothetical protein
MDRQPLTDRLGDRLLAEYGGAAAAYSLRALNGNGDSVVRVRRASDNDEKDFTAEQIELGEMVNWVNSQTVPPLDIGVETSEGRIPVPEGGTSIGTPAAAYSLRNLSTTYTGNVVDVRRSSDNTVASFTASQISNGQMLDFVGGDNTIIQSEDFTSGSWNKSSGRVVITSNSITAPDGELTADLATWSTPNNADSLRQDKSFLAQQYTVSIYLKYNSAQWVQMYFGSTGFTGGHANFDLINGVIGGNKVGSSSIEDVGDGWYRCSVTRTASTSGNTAICATVPVSSGLASRFGAEVAGAYYVWGGQMNEGSIKAYTMTTTGVSGNGFVSKWYDQSGNDNHATQGTAASQPKIVDAGVLVRGNTGEPAFTGDGVDDILSLSSSINFGTGEFFVSTVVDVDTGGVVIGSASPNWMLLVTTSSIQVRASNTNVIYIISPDSVLTAGESYLISLSRVGNDITAYVNGVAQADVETVVSTDTFSADRFLQRGTNGNPYPDPVSEVIIYNSDQSANRTAIEANIGETYGITGIPAYDNTVDGFVETWYDQSGNGNDATQSVAASQPKIVDAGVLVSGGIDFDGVDDRLTCPSLYSSDISIFNVATTSNTVNTGNFMRMVHLCDGSDSFQITRGGSTEIGKLLSKNTAFQSGAPAFRHGDINGINLISAVTSSTDTDAFIDGSLQSNGSLTLGSGNSTTTTIGARDDLLSSGFFAGSHAEIIIYPSDQSANRPAIETNINDHYNIY